MLTNERLAHSKTLVLFIGFTLVGFIGIIDYVTGIEISFSIFYLLPVTFVAWFSNKKTAMLVASLSAVTWLYADMEGQHLYSKAWIPYWNAAVRFGYFNLGIFYITKVKDALHLQITLNKIDFLTGVSTSRAFYEYLEREKKRCLDNKKPLTIAYIDCDNFKFINDNLGHQTGDAVLKQVGQTIKNNLRTVDIVARLGGDEFAIILPESETKVVVDILTRVRESLLNSMNSNNWPVTFSIGAITFIVPSKSTSEMIKEADNLMYAVKKSHKNMLRHKLVD